MLQPIRTTSENVRRPDDGWQTRRDPLASPRGSEGYEDLQRPHAFQHIADADTETYFSNVMVLKGTSTDKDLEVGVSVVREKESYVL